MKTFLTLFLLITFSWHSNGQTFFRTYSAGNNESGRLFFEMDSGFILLNTVYLGLYNSELLRLGPNGDSLWQKYYPNGIFNYGQSQLSRTFDNNFVTAKAVADTGISDSINVYDVDTLGYISFRFALVDTIPIGVGGIIQTRDSGFLICGSYQKNYGIFDSDVYMIKTDALGNIEWKKKMSHANYGCPQGTSNLTETSDNHYLATVYSSFCSMLSPGLYELIRIDSAGNSISVYSELAYPVTAGRSLIEKNGNCIYLEILDSNSTNYFKYRKINSTGNVVWEKTVSLFSPAYFTLTNSVTNGFYMSGILRTNPYQAVITRFNDAGDSLYSFLYSGTGNLVPNYIEQLQDGRLALIGVQEDPVSSNGNPRQVFFLIADSLGNILNHTILITPVTREIQISPNSFSKNVYISNFSEGMILSVFDMQERMIFTSLLTSSNVDLSELKAGTYLFMVRDKNREWWRIMEKQ